MRRLHRWTEAIRARLRLDDEGGTAALEFILVGLLLLVPIVYLIVALGSIQGQTLGAEAGARHIARVVATAENPDDADARADRILATVVAEYGLDADAVEVRVACTDSAGECPRAGATVVVTVATQVALPLVPPVLGLDRLAVVPVEATAAQKVSRFWSDE
jgi:Flp pilus assembly protein TadG